MEILLVLRNLYGNPDPFEDELIIGDSDVNAISEACEIRDMLNGLQGGVGTESKLTALLFSETSSDSTTVLKKAISYGADRVIHAPTDDFDFTDANLFSRLIADTVKSCFDAGDLGILMFGRLAYDGDSVNIATQTAERLGWSRAIYSKSIIGTDSGLTFIKSLDGGNTAEVRVPFPAVLHSIRKEELRRQAKISDILRAYGTESNPSKMEIESIPISHIEKLTEKAKAMSTSTLGKGIQEIPPYSEAKEMINLNGISDIETAQNIINTLKALGFQPKSNS